MSCEGSTSSRARFAGQPYRRSSAFLVVVAASMLACDDGDASARLLEPWSSGPLREPAPPPAWVDDAAFRRASTGDALDRLAFAQRVGAVELVAGYDAVDDRAWLLAAIEDAPDAPAALGGLCDRLAWAADDAERESLLRAIHAVAARPLEPREVLDPEGLSRCQKQLTRLVEREPSGGIAPLAEAARRAFARRQ